MGQAALPAREPCKPLLLIIVASLVLAANSQDVHSSIRTRNTVLEPAHYKTESTSSSTREEDLVQHVQAEPDEALASQLTQEAPHIQFSAVQHATSADTTFQKDSTNKEHWREKNETHSTVAVPQLELVVSRSMEKLEWLSRVPSFWQVTIINRGGKDSRALKTPRGRKWNVINSFGIASDSEAFAHHIVNRYYSLAEYTVFSPARPLQLNGRFIELLQTPTKLGIVQALSGKAVSRASDRFATDRISTRTLNSVLTHDPSSVEIARWFSKDYNLTWGQNLVKKYFDMIGLHEWMNERQEVGSTAPQGMLGVERSRVTRHSKSIYESLFSSITVFGGNTFVVDRIWLMLFAGSDFEDTLT